MTPPGGRRDAIAKAPASARRLLYLAAFFTFWSLGFIVDVMQATITPIPEVLVTAMLTGLTAVTFVYVAAFHPKWFPLVLTAMVGVMFANAFYQRGDPGVALTDASLDEVRLKLLVDGIGSLLGFVCSYTFFMGFIGAESSRHARVVAEIELAREIHGLLVPAVSEHRGRFEFYGVSTPSTEVGGDLVDVVPAGDGWVGYVADVTGHGVGAGVLMGMFKSAMRTRIAAGGSLDAVFADVNRVLHPLRKSNMFVTAAAIHDDGRGALTYAVAGHPPVLHYRAATGTVSELTTPGVPLGVFEERPFMCERVEIAPGDLLVVVTDGLSEVFDRHDVEFGMERLKQTIQEAAGLPLAGIAATLQRKTREHGVQSDDQTLLLIRLHA